MNIPALWQIIVLSFVVAAMSCTISKANVFEEARWQIKKRNEWAGKLISCPYCTSHWLAAFFVLVYPPVLFEKQPVIDFFVSLFVVVALSAIIAGVIRRMSPFHADGALLTTKYICNIDEDGME